MRTALLVVSLAGVSVFFYVAQGYSQAPRATQPPPAPKETIEISKSRYESLIGAEQQLKGIENRIKVLKDTTVRGFESLDRSWQTITWVIGVAYVILGAVTTWVLYLGPVLLRRQIKSEVKTRALDAEEKLQSLLTETDIRLFRSLAFLFDSIALFYFYDKEYIGAIGNVIISRRYAEEAYKASEDDPDIQLYINHLKSNEAYYKACVGEEKYRSFCLDTCEDIILPLAKETGKVGVYMDNYLFILKEYGRTPEEKERWITTYEEYKDPVTKELRGSPRYRYLIRIYKRHYKQWQQEIQSLS